MSRHAEEPLTKVTLNLFTSDVEFYKRYYGDQEYTSLIRWGVRRDVNQRKTAKRKMEEAYDEARRD